MSFLDRLERVFGRFSIPNLSLYLVMGQVFVLLTTMFHVLEPSRLVYAPVLVLHGQWWRLITFLFETPIPTSAFNLGFVWLAFGWYLFYLMGSALESYWGAFRFNLFIFISYALTVGLAFITPDYGVTNIFILGSVFLAFAYLNPDFELVLFFILPVKIKWLALLAWVGNAAMFYRGTLSVRLQIAASIASFAVFFGGDILRTIRQGRRTSARRAQAAATAEEPRHTCHVCGRTDLTHPQLDFRYCSKCAGDQCYCPDHIGNHAHVVAANDPAAR